MPTLAKGNNVYQPSQGTYGAASATLPAPTENRAGGGANEDAEEETLPILPPSSLISLPIPPASELDIAAARPSSNAFTSRPSTSTSAASKRKRSALSALQPSSGASKKACANTGAAAMNGIKESIDNFNVTFSKSVLVQPERMRPDSSLERRAKAVELIQVQEDYLTHDQLVAFLDYFKADTAAADIYLAIKREGLRKAWIQKQLSKELGFPQQSL